MEEQPMNGSPQVVLHPHRKLYAVISVVVFVFLLGFVAAYRVMKVREAATALSGSTATSLEDQQRAANVAEYQKAMADIPPLTDAQRKEAVAEYKKKMAKIPPLTDKQRADSLAAYQAVMQTVSTN